MGSLPIAGRIIGQFGHVDDGIDTFQVGDIELTDVFDERFGRGAGRIVEPSDFVIPSINAGNFMALPQQKRREQ